MMKRIIISCCCLLLVALILSGASRAASELFELPWWTVDGGGGISQGGGYTLSYTIGQPEAGVMSSENFVLEGGFRAGGAPVLLPQGLFLPLVIND
jgi:hypothetical protein